MSRLKPLCSLDDVLTEIGFGVFHYCVIFILGITALVDSMEILFLAFIVPILKCAWNLNSFDISLIGIGVCVGMVLGSCSLGKCSDMFGRKPILLIGVASIIYFAIASTISPTLTWFIILRTIVGFFVGANTGNIATYSAEIMPLKYRMTGMMAISVFWTLAPLIQTVLVISIVEKYSWKTWLLVSASSHLLIFPFFLWLPESPRFLLAKERVTEALQVINKIAIMNKKEFVTQLKIPEPTEAKLFDIFHEKYRLSSCLLFYIWFLYGFSYYGFLQSAAISFIPHRCLQDRSRVSYPELYHNVSSDSSCCQIFLWANSSGLLVSTLGEIIVCTFTLIFGKYFRRKVYIFLLIFITMIMYILINLCLSPIYIGVLLMIGRGSTSCLFGVVYLYTSEVYPTSIRSFTIGFGGSFANIGSMLSQLIFNFLVIEKSFLGGTMLYFLMNFLGLVCVVLLPYETKDMNLRQGVNEEIETNGAISFNAKSYGSNAN